MAAPKLGVGMDGEYTVRDTMAQLIAAKNRITSISGTIPLDASQLVLFFRTKVCQFPLRS